MLSYPSPAAALQVRMLEGVACLEGVDTLLLLLLAELGDARQVAAFAAVPNAVDLAAVQPRLEVGGRMHGGRGGWMGGGSVGGREALASITCLSVCPFDYPACGCCRANAGTTPWPRCTRRGAVAPPLRCTSGASWQTEAWPPPPPTLACTQRSDKRLWSRQRHCCVIPRPARSSSC